ncbi:tetratricopeptide repeat protein [Gayadomonas joobiniege]|uniref:tetratricopeptide repeat protein n=1 Tax=Gayadomonas joobiniege TaxID=1234606 RepID=UPI000374B0E1|nr:sel1 repeat family protein [Gayadomonas joobiniege]
MSASLHEYHWITIQEASSITGASLAIIQDTVHKYSHNPNKLKTQYIDGDLYVDKNQIINLFPASANVIEKERVPATLFKWFDELRRTYEASINAMFNRVETLKQAHTDELKQQYDAQLKHLQSHIKKLEQDAQFYQQQLSEQQQTIKQLNERYDTVMHALASQHRAPLPSKDITPVADKIESMQVPTADKTDKPKIQAANTQLAQDIQKALNHALKSREQQDYISAADYFEQAALLGCTQAMGALGRAYFIAEGVAKDIEKGLAWLLLAAEHGFVPAQQKLPPLQNKYPQAYQDALEQVEIIKIQIEIQQSDYY